MPGEEDVQAGGFRVSDERDPVHWKCPDCMEECRCVGEARLMPHERCGYKEGDNRD